MSDSESENVSFAVIDIDAVPTKREPQRIVTYGAEVDDVNGVYEFFGRYLTHPCYRKRRSSNSHFYIVPVVDGTRWVIERSDNEDENGGAESKTILFASNRICPNSFLQFPLARGWWSMNPKHQHSPPIVLPENKRILDWRHSPEESLADYKIEITHKRHDDDGAMITATYFAHKLILSSASEYFARVCVRNDSTGPSFVEVKVQTIRLELEPSTAAIIPQFLDYLYEQYSSSLLSTNFQPPRKGNLVRLYWLADYFQAPGLCQEVMDAFEYNLALFPRTCASLAQRARELQIPLMYDKAVSFCANNLASFGDEELECTSKTATETFILDFLQKPGITEARSRNASRIVTMFCSDRILDVDTFKRMVDPTVLPCIHSSVVWELLEMEADVCGSSVTSELSNLQERCVEALARDFVDLDRLETTPLSLQSASFLHQLIIKSQQRAKALLEVARAESEGGNDRNVRQRVH